MMGRTTIVQMSNKKMNGSTKCVSMRSNFANYFQLALHWQAIQQPDKLKAIQRCVARGKPYGQEQWSLQTVKILGLESTLRPRERP